MLGKRIAFYLVMFSFVGVSIWIMGSVAIRVYQERIIIRDTNAKFFKINAYLIPDEQLGWKNCSNCRHYHPDLRTPACARPGFCKIYEFGRYGNRTTSKSPGNGNPTRTIWVMGDSSAFGLGVRGDETFSERLRRSLRDKDIDVINFSVVGYNTYQIFQSAKRNLERIRRRPSMLVIWGGFNDLEVSRRFFFRDLIPVDISPWVIKRNVRRTIDLCEDLHIPVVINTIPSREDSAVLSRYRDWLLSIHDPDNGIIVNDVRKRFESESGKDLYADYDSTFNLPMVFHPGPDGHRIVSEMLEEIVERQLPGSGETRG